MSITPDVVNSLFELVGAWMTFGNFRRVMKDRGYAGVNKSAVGFFTLWGMWNLYFYPSVHSYMSFLAAMVLYGTNILWLTAMAVYGKKS